MAYRTCFQKVTKMKLFALPVVLATKDYTNFSRLRLNWTDPVVGESVFNVLENLETLDLWRPDSLESIFHTLSADFIVGPDETENLIEKLTAESVQFERVTADVGAFINEEQEKFYWTRLLN